jgi:hypothetical protein
MITYSIVRTEEELKGVLHLLEQNLVTVLSDEEEKKEGFLTVAYSYADLKKMQDTTPGIIATENNAVVAYLLAMDPAFKADFPILKSFFELFETIKYKDKPVSTWHYLVIGQACIDKNYRGKGILRKIYDAYSNLYREKFDFAISEIATRNLRSMNAHKRIGFIPVHEYTGPDGVQWTVVILDWTKWPLEIK